MDIYKLKGYIGEGAHGYVMRALNTVTNEDVALKKLVIRSANEGIPNNILREIKVLQQVDCLYVVKLLNIVAQGTGFVLVMEYLPLALSDILKNHNKPLMESQIKKYMKMLLLGMSYLHDVNIMHRDLKPANLLISESGTLKIADFGLARIYSPDEPERPYSHQVATRWYRAPELLYGSRKYTPSIDIWATGCIFGEMINKAPLFPGETDIEQLAIVLRTLGTPSEEQWPEMKSLPDYNKISFPEYTGIPWSQILPDTRPHVVDFIKRFIQYDNKKRISANEAVLHPYFFIKPLECEMKHMPKPIDYEEEYLNEPDSLLHDLHEILSLH